MANIYCPHVATCNDEKDVWTTHAWVSYDHGGLILSLQLLFLFVSPPTLTHLLPSAWSPFYPDQNWMLQQHNGIRKNKSFVRKQNHFCRTSVMQPQLLCSVPFYSSIISIVEPFSQEHTMQSCSIFHPCCFEEEQDPILLPDVFSFGAVSMYLIVNGQHGRLLSCQFSRVLGKLVVCSKRLEVPAICCWIAVHRRCWSIAIR